MKSRTKRYSDELKRSFGQETHMFRVRKWLDRKLGIDVFELHGDQIVKDKGRAASDILALRDIGSWSVEYAGSFDIVTLRLTDSTELRWVDKYDDLLGILRSVAKEKEQEARTTA